MVGAVLVHDGEPLDALLRRPGFGDIDDPRIEIAVLAGDPLVDLVGDDMGDAAPVLPGRRVGEAGELLLGEYVPQPELDPEFSVALLLHRAGDQRLGVDLAPIAEARAFARRDVLDEAARIERPEQAGTLQIGRNDLRDVVSDTPRTAAACE